MRSPNDTHPAGIAFAFLGIVVGSSTVQPDQQATMSKQQSTGPILSKRKD